MPENLQGEEAKLVAKGPENEVHHWNWRQLWRSKLLPRCSLRPCPQLGPPWLNTTEWVKARRRRTAVAEWAPRDAGLRAPGISGSLASASTLAPLCTLTALNRCPRLGTLWMRPQLPL